MCLSWALRASGRASTMRATPACGPSNRILVNDMTRLLVGGSGTRPRAHAVLRHHDVTDDAGLAGQPDRLGPVAERALDLPDGHRLRRAGVGQVLDTPDDDDV